MNTQSKSDLSIEKIELDGITKKKFINYAMSVIKSRALPDIRDGLKPVHRRIIYTMYNDLDLIHSGRFKKSAKIVGDVIGKYHPHGDIAVYDAMVRLAQDFNMKITLVNGQGNFGSIDADPPAAYRYTEAKLTEFASLLIEDIDKNTVEFTPTYDESGIEPVVLPSKIPNLLINGSIGIAVGMATNIPSHNLEEVINALIFCIEQNNQNITTRKLLTFIKGPDFPTGGNLICNINELEKIYECGKGTLKLQCEYKTIDDKIIITNIPYGVVKKDLIEQISKLIDEKEIIGLVNCSDLSTKEIYIELEFDNKLTSVDKIIYLLTKKTSFEKTVGFDFTCLNEFNQPKRFSLLEILESFIRFRIEVLIKSYKYELDLLTEQIHILKGFEILFNDLDNAIKLIRNSKNKKEVVQNLITKYDLDDLQADKIAERKLYTLSSDLILEIKKELQEKRERSEHIIFIIKNDNEIKNEIKNELILYKTKFGSNRLTKLIDPIEEIEDEELLPDLVNSIVITKQGKIKKQTNISENLALQTGDSLLQIITQNLKYKILIFTSLGRTFQLKTHILSSGKGKFYGDPIQNFLKFKDGEKILHAISLDPDVTKELKYQKPILGNEYEDPYPHIICVSKLGYIVKYSIWDAIENKKHKFKIKNGDEFVFISQCYESSKLLIEGKIKMIEISVNNILINQLLKKLNNFNPSATIQIVTRS